MRTFHFYLLFVVTLSSCNFYKPGLVNTPLLENKLDGNIGVSLGRTFGAQASFSPIENIGIMASYSNAMPVSETRDIDSDGEGEIVNTFSNQQYEFGLGYYKRFTEEYYFEIYGGYGKGEAGIAENFLHSSDESNERAFEALHEGWFLQSSFAFKPEKNISLVFSGKLAHNTFYDFNVSPFFAHSPTYFASPRILSFQPTMSFVFEESYFKGFFQAGFFLHSGAQFYSARWLNASFGVALNLNKFTKKVTSRKDFSGDYVR